MFAFGKKIREKAGFVVVGYSFVNFNSILPSFWLANYF